MQLRALMRLLRLSTTQWVTRCIETYKGGTIVEEI